MFHLRNVKKDVEMLDLHVYVKQNSLINFYILYIEK